MKFVLCETNETWEDYELCQSCLCDCLPPEEEDGYDFNTDAHNELRQQGYFSTEEYEEGEPCPLDTRRFHGPWPGEAAIFNEWDLWIEIPF